MATKQIYQFTITALLIVCLQVGYNNTGDSGGFTHAACYDGITAKLLTTDNYLPGQYSVELLFSDNESIIA